MLRVLQSVRRTAWLAAACVLFAFPASQASAQHVHPLVAECRAALDESPAESHCPALYAHAVAENPGGPSHTCWVVGDCTLTVAVDGSDTSFESNIEWSSPVYLSPSDLRLLDFCFARTENADQEQAEWTMSLSPGGCADGETDSDTAMTEGLSTQEEE